MSYSVVWKPNAEAEIIQLYVENKDHRKLLNQAINWFETNVAQRPKDFGESRGGTTRIVVIESVVLVYEIIEDDHRIDVLTVRMM